MIAKRLAPTKIQMRQATALSLSDKILRIVFHILLALTALWAYECIVGNAFPYGNGFEGWSGFPIHYDYWSDSKGGPIVDHTEERLKAIRSNISICCGTTVFLGFALFIIGKFAFRRNFQTHLQPDT